MHFLLFVRTDRAGNLFPVARRERAERIKAMNAAATSRIYVIVEPNDSRIIIFVIDPSHSHACSATIITNNSFPLPYSFSFVPQNACPREHRNVARQIDQIRPTVPRTRACTTYNLARLCRVANVCCRPKEICKICLTIWTPASTASLSHFTTPCLFRPYSFAFFPTHPSWSYSGRRLKRTNGRVDNIDIKAHHGSLPHNRISL